MSHPISHLDVQAIRRATKGFAQALSARALLTATARLEARLAADGSDPLFALEAALAAAWPGAIGALPRHEVIWASAACDPAEGLRLSAFDAAGRLLLRRSYATRGARKAAGHD